MKGDCKKQHIVTGKQNRPCLRMLVRNAQLILVPIPAYKSG